MSADAEAALGGAQALSLLAVPASISSFSDVPLCHVCRACVLFFLAGGRRRYFLADTRIPKIVLLGKVEQQHGGRAYGCVDVFVGCLL